MSNRQKTNEPRTPDPTKSQKQFFEFFSKFGEVKKKKPGLLFKTQNAEHLILFKNVTYLGHPHPFFKKRIQIPGTWRGHMSSPKTIILGVYTQTKQKEDEEHPKKVKSNEVLFGCTGTIGEVFPKEKIKSSVKNLIDKIKYTQNKYLWIKAAMGILTTDLKPKLAMEECSIGNTKVKIYGIAKGSGMIFPNMGTTLAYIFTDAELSSNVLKKILKKNIQNTFNAISCDGDTSTNDMVTIFSTGKAKNKSINNINDIKLKDFDLALNNVLLNLAKRVVSDGEGATKFIKINSLKCSSESDAKKISFSIANSPLVKTAITGEDPNWGRILMAAGKAGVEFEIDRVNLFIGEYKILDKGQLIKNYIEKDVADYMKQANLEISIEINNGNKSFTCYTMDFTQKYISINSDYRS